MPTEPGKRILGEHPELPPKAPVEGEVPAAPPPADAICAGSQTGKHQLHTRRITSFVRAPRARGSELGKPCEFPQRSTKDIHQARLGPDIGLFQACGPHGTRCLPVRTGPKTLSSHRKTGGTVGRLAVSRGGFCRTRLRGTASVSLETEGLQERRATEDIVVDAVEAAVDQNPEWSTTLGHESGAGHPRLGRPGGRDAQRPETPQEDESPGGV